MNTASTVDELDGFPFLTFDGVQEAIRSGDASFALHDSMIHRLSYSLISETKPGIITIAIMEWSTLWVTIACIALSWSTFGLSSLWLLGVGFLSFLVSRPYGSFTIPSIVFLGIVGGLVMGSSWVTWGSINWFAAWYVSYVWYSVCKTKFVRKLLQDEEFFVEAYRVGAFALDLKGGGRYFATGR